MTGAKDERLATLGEKYNVAQFVSFSPGTDPSLRYQKIRGNFTGTQPAILEHTIGEILKNSAGSVNIRSFRLDQDKGNPFTYGITKVNEAAAKVRRLAAQGYYTIVNETLDANDGGVSGVMLGGILEFTPFDTPRGVEKPGTVSVPHKLGIEILSTIYGFRPELSPLADARVEFSVHPLRVGYRNQHTLLWEFEPVGPLELTSKLHWPNRLSSLVGDKAFGLLIAHLLDLPVPKTTVIPREIAPFEFGRPTGTAEFWMRTCPTEPQPGRFSTTYGWSDPYKVMASEDPGASAIASILAQESVLSQYSGASRPNPDQDQDYVEGVLGRGDAYMLGSQAGDHLPKHVVRDVRELAGRARKVLGPVRMEFVHDGERAWIVQLHLDPSPAAYHPGIISPGSPENGWLDFDPALGLAHLNEVIDQAQHERRGVRIVAPVGITSHVGDLLRRAGVPARLEFRS